MLGIAYAQRSLIGATRGRESGNLPRHLQVTWLTALCSHKAVPPFQGYDSVVVCRAPSKEFGSHPSPGIIKLYSNAHFALLPAA
jgi:hypothetical protein